MKRQIITVLFIVCLFATSFLALTVQPVEATSAFTTKSAEISINCIKSGQALYNSSWATLLHNLNIETLRLHGGNNGDVWGINMFQNSDWADNLEALLALIDSNGFKCYFQSLGDPWGMLFGINDLNRVSGDNAPDGTGIINATGLLDINTVKSKIDLLANEGDGNSQNHNFITDSRIVAWSIGNECSCGSVGATNDVYTWVTAIMDYIRGKGGVVIADSPDIDGYTFENTVPYFEAHADYMEIHAYHVWELTNYYSLGGSSYDWDGWKSVLQTFLQDQMNNRGSFAATEVIVGEFGLWLGTATDMGVTATFTNQNRIDYYTHYFEALEAVGYKWVSFFSAFWASSYFMIDMPSGTLLDGCSVIATAYQDVTPTTTPVPSVTPTTTPIPSPTGTPTITPAPTATPFVSTAQTATNQVFTNVYLALGIAVVSTLIAGCYIIIASFNSGNGNVKFGVGLVLVSIIEVVIGVVVVNAFQGSMGTVAISLLSIKGIT
jgi:hypothetical protein